MDLRHSKPFRITLLLITALIAVVGIAPWFLQADFAQNALVAQMEHDTQRTLNVQGRTRLVLLPRPSLLLDKVTLTEPHSTQVFAQAEHVRVEFSVWPLLRSRSVVVHRLDVDHPQVHIERQPDGTYNFDDLLRKRDVGSGINFDIDRVAFSDGDLAYRDNGLNENFRLTNLQWNMDKLGDPKNGELALDGELQVGPPQALQWHGKIKGTAAMRYHAQERRLLVADLRLDITQQGDSSPSLKVADSQITAIGNLVYGWQPLRLTGGDLRLSASGKRAGQSWTGELDLPEIGVVHNVISLNRLKLQVDMQSPGNRLSAQMMVPKLSGNQGGVLRADAASINVALNSPGQKLTAKFVSPLEMQGGTRFSLPAYNLTGSYSNAALPRGEIGLQLAGNSTLDLRSEFLHLASRGQLDHEPVSMSLGVNDFVSPEYQFDFNISKLDLTPYLPVVSEGAKQVDPSKDLDFTWLQHARAQGQVRIGELVVKNLHVDDIAMSFNAKDRKLTLDPLQATLYEGQLTGSMEIDTSGDQPAFHARQRLTDTNINTLLVDVLDTSRFEGRGQVDLDISGRGTSLEDLRRTTNGSAHLQLKEGAIRGIDVEALLRNTSKQLALLGGDITQPADLDARTRFTQLQASLQIKDGVARNSDLAVATGVIKLTGNGAIDLGQGYIDYQMQATANSRVPELASLAGLTLPITLSGPLASPDYHVDYGDVKEQFIKRQKAAAEKAEKARAAAAKAAVKPAKAGKSAPPTAVPPKKKP
ncbi:AsmA family protein [Silvimonas soli]|uniref:AsmA family protein n=1 Tax=Silvimonas soli TaxID=2980100 RepID=UPI0024B3BB07|nr:AsmA family protein [Silvimonas soli]